MDPCPFRASEFGVQGFHVCLGFFQQRALMAIAEVEQDMMQVMWKPLESVILPLKNHSVLMGQYTAKAHCNSLDPCIVKPSYSTYLDTCIVTHSCRVENISEQRRGYARRTVVGHVSYCQH